MDEVLVTEKKKIGAVDRADTDRPSGNFVHDVDGRRAWRLTEHVHGSAVLPRSEIAFGCDDYLSRRVLYFDMDAVEIRAATQVASGVDSERSRGCALDMTSALERQRSARAPDRQHHHSRQVPHVAPFDEMNAASVALCSDVLHVLETSEVF